MSVVFILTDKIIPAILIGQEGETFLLKTKDGIVREKDIYYQLTTAMAVLYEKIVAEAKELTDTNGRPTLSADSASILL